MKLAARATAVAGNVTTFKMSLCSKSITMTRIKHFKLVRHEVENLISVCEEAVKNFKGTIRKIYGRN